MMTFIAAIIEPNLKLFYLKFNKKRLDWIKNYRFDHGVIENASFEPRLWLQIHLNDSSP